MIRSFKNITIISTMLLLAACGGDNISKKKAELEELKKQQATTTENIAKLEAEIAKLDPASAKQEKAKLVTLAAVAPEQFTHFIDLQGKIEAENISIVTPRLGPGQVRAVYVKKGQQVNKGQLLLKLDDAVVRQQVAAAKQNLEVLKTQLVYVKDIYNRQNNLWKQGIGTEVQLITAKNNVENVEKQLAASEASIKTVQEQLSGSNVYADVSGVADEVNIKVGETFTGMAGTTPQIRIVNTNDLKVTAQIPENYLSRVHVGSKVKVTLPDINKTVEATITVAGKLIDPLSRSFYIEAKIPTNKDFKPNQVAVINIQDYTAANATTVPVNTLQTDEKGKFVLVAAKEGNRLIAKKRPVTIGELYGEKLEVKSGLQAGDQIIVEGFQGLYDGQLITTTL